MLDVSGHHMLVCGDLLMERIGLHLVDHRCDLVECSQIGQTYWAEIAHADGADLAFLVEFFECVPRTVYIGEWLMQQDQIQIIQSQPP